MPDGLYERDSLAWAERQSDLLRRLAAGERVNEAVDWAHVIEEIHDVGLSELRSCESFLNQLLVHVLKLHAWPSSSAVVHWADEAMLVSDEARRRFSPSMRQRIDVAKLYAAAIRRVRRFADETGPARPLPDACPFTLDELLAGDGPPCWQSCRQATGA